MPGAVTKKLPRSVAPNEPMFIRINSEYQSSWGLTNVSPMRPPNFLSSDEIAGVAARRLLADKPRSGRKESKDDTSTASGSASDTPTASPDARRSFARTKDDTSTASGSASDTPTASPDVRRSSARTKDDAPRKDDVEVSGPRTTVTLQGIPAKYTRKMLQQLLDEEGFERCYDLVYLPVDFVTQRSLGYALVNLTSVVVANRFFAHFTNMSLAVSWSDILQGLLPCVEWYRNSPVMHATVPADYKPLLFADGVPVLFPPPTQPINAPQLRMCQSQAQTPTKAQSPTAAKDSGSLPKVPLCAPPPGL